MELYKEFEQNWKKQGFPSRNQTVLIAVSGGKDSMALAYLMHRMGCSIALAHCNFQLRGTESDLDEQLVKDWASSHNIKLHHIAFDTQKIMAESGTGVQETARKLRYDWFADLCIQEDYCAVATAHHANDNAETLLINLCKGTGMAGLHGIPLRNNKIIRPLLFATRNQIEDFVLTEQIPFREDASNTSTKYLRNAVRHNIIPVLNELFPDVVQRLNENIARFAQAEIIYKEAVTKEIGKLIEKRGSDLYIPILKLQKRTAYETICYELFSAYGFSAAQIPEILKLLKSESGHYVSSATHRVIRNRMFLIITVQRSEETDFLLVEHLPQTIRTTEGTFHFSLIENQDPANTSNHIALLNFEQMQLPLVLRRKRTGDYFYPLGMGMKKKKVSRFMIDQKLALQQKERLWIVENNKQIVWVAGLRPDERFKLGTGTKKILRIEFLSE